MTATFLIVCALAAIWIWASERELREAGRENDRLRNVITTLHDRLDALRGRAA